jgi:hypothetical protein
MAFVTAFTWGLVLEANAGWTTIGTGEGKHGGTIYWALSDNGNDLVGLNYVDGKLQGLSVLRIDEIEDVSDNFAADYVADVIKEAAGTDNPNPEAPSGGAGSSDPRPGLVRELLKGVSKPILTMTFEESPRARRLCGLSPPWTRSISPVPPVTITDPRKTPSVVRVVKARPSWVWI